MVVLWIAKQGLYIYMTTIKQANNYGCNKRAIALRQEHDYTQSQIAKYLKISTYKYQNKENGQSLFNDIEILKLSRLYLVTASYLIRGCNDWIEETPQS